MAKYECDACGMGVEGLTCTKCGCELEHSSIKTPDGKTVNVAACPEKCGKIKSPTCCGHDMKASG
jgi:hypothetical protein